MSGVGLDMEILARYRIEPRSVYQESNSYLVVYDKYLERYVEEEENRHHAYRRFKNSDEFFTYLMQTGGS